MRAILKMMRLWIKGGVKKNTFSKFILYLALQRMDQRLMYHREGNYGSPGEREHDYERGHKLCRRRGVDGYAELPR